MKTLDANVVLRLVYRDDALPVVTFDQRFARDPEVELLEREDT